MPFITGGGGATTSAGVRVLARKTTVTDVVNTVTETDLLNGEITVAATAMGTTGALRLTAYGDCINNTGSTQAAPRMKLKLGSTTIFDTGAPANGWAANAGRFEWWIQANILNTTATAQVSRFIGVTAPLAAASIGPGFTTGEGILESPGASHSLVANGFNSTAVDTTVSNVLALTMILPTAALTCEYELFGALLELL